MVDEVSGLRARLDETVSDLARLRVQLASGMGLPNPSGQAGKKLSTDGTLPQWVPDGGATGALLIPLYAGQLSTKATSGNKRLLGSIQFDPASPSWGLRPTSTARLCALLETTNGLSAASADLLFRPTTGSPAVIAALPSVTALVATLTTVDVSSYFRPSASPGVLQLRLWSALATESSTCTGAWIEVTP